MRKKYKMTGFARFLIFMVFFAPLAYLGASYYNGEDGIGNIKKLLGLDQDAQAKNINLPEVSKDEIIKMKEEEIKVLKQRIENLEAELSKTQQ